MALKDEKIISLEMLKEYNTNIKGWVNDKFFVGTKEMVTEAFDTIPNGTFVFITDDPIDIGDLTALEPTSDDIGDLFDATNDEDGDDTGNAEDLFG